MAAIKKMANVIFSRCIRDSVRFLLYNRYSRKNSSVESFKFNDLIIEIANESQKINKPDLSTAVFGETFSDHMFEVNWHLDNGWGIPRIVPLHPFPCHPGSMIFQNCQAVFEGMKAYRCSDGSVNLFRANLNAERLVGSAERASLPPFDGEEFLKCLKKLISIDKDWVPDGISSSLYIRPTIIGIQNKMKVESSNTAYLYIITCPVGPYFKTNQVEPISLLADPTYIRAWPGGVGDKKMAANYAPTFYVQKIAQQQGLDEVLWLRGDDHEVAEGGCMNVFFVFQKGPNEFELATPNLDGTILPGITRKSILDLTRGYKEFGICERKIKMSEITEAVEKETLKEIFICGTAAVLCPVNKIRYGNRDLNIPTMKSEISLYERLYKDLSDIQYGRVESDWTIKID